MYSRRCTYNITLFLHPHQFFSANPVCAAFFGHLVDLSVQVSLHETDGPKDAGRSLGGGGRLPGMAGSLNSSAVSRCFGCTRISAAGHVKSDGPDKVICHVCSLTVKNTARHPGSGVLFSRVPGPVSEIKVPRAKPSAVVCGNKEAPRLCAELSIRNLQRNVSVRLSWAFSSCVFAFSRI